MPPSVFHDPWHLCSIVREDRSLSWRAACAFLVVSAPRDGGDCVLIGVTYRKLRAGGAGGGTHVSPSA